MERDPRQEPQSSPLPDGRGPVDTAGMGQLPPAPPPQYWPPLWPPPRRRRWPWVLALTLLVVLLLVFGLFALLGTLVAVPAQFFAAGTAPREIVYHKGDMTRRIVILPLEGPVAAPMEQRVRQALKHLEADRPVAVVLRVDSPGGEVGAADRIWHMLAMFRDSQKVPLVASMGSFAASGGYYISVAAKHVVAEPTSITGSIGVIMPAASIEQMLQKIGVTPHVLVATDSPQKDVGSFVRPWTEDDRRILQAIIDNMQQRFIQVVAEGRSMTTAQVQAVATGAPLTAQQALDRKLVDEVGYLDAALSRAKDLAGLPPESTPAVTILRGPSGFFAWLSQDDQAMTADAAAWMRQAAQEALYPSVQYRLPLN